MIACPDCGSVSHHPRDLAEGYCGKCHDWTMAPRVTVDVEPPDIFQWWWRPEGIRAWRPKETDTPSPGGP
jgi:hypothetical protein